MNDVGLLRRHSKLVTTAFVEGNRLFTEFKGALTENYCLQGLINQYEVMPRYWAEAPYEVDFIIQDDNDIIPIEVKSQISINSTSLKNYTKKYKNNTSISIRLSLKNLSFDGNVLNVPLFMIDELSRLVRRVKGLE